MRNYISLLLLLFTLLIANLSFAQTEKKTFNSKFYSLTIPENWITVSGELSEDELQKLPQNLKDQYNPQAIDAMFINLNDPKIKEDDFKDTMNIILLDDQVPITKESLQTLKPLLEQQYKSIFEDFKPHEMTIENLKDIPVLIFKAQYKILNYNVGLHQYIVTSSSKSLVFTCTFEQKRKEEVIQKCQNTIESITFKD